MEEAQVKAEPAAIPVKTPQCSKRGCELDGTKKFGGSCTYCDKHVRFIQMRGGAKANGKYVPTYGELEKAFLNCLSIVCIGCGQKMEWFSLERKRTITLQHDFDGKIRLLCFSCNVRYKAYKSEQFYLTDNTFRKCTACKQFKSPAEFHKDKTKYLGLGSRCRPCNIKYRRDHDRIRKINSCR